MTNDQPRATRSPAETRAFLRTVELCGRARRARGSTIARGARREGPDELDVVAHFLARM